MLNKGTWGNVLLLMVKSDERLLLRERITTFYGCIILQSTVS